MRSFADDIRAFLIPERKWHYIFHLVVVAVAAAYWVASLAHLPNSSWAELVIYRPLGDNQIYPAISALSRFNFGDPTDALHYGEGTAGSQVVILLPHALLYAIFGGAGYMVADILLSWLFFMAATLLLRRCNFGNFSSLAVGSALATNSLQCVCAKIGQCLTTFVCSFGFAVWEWGFPNLLELQIFVKRIPRPIVTETLLVLLLYFLIRQWHERRLPSVRRGFAIGTLMALLAQGDPYSAAALGLLLLWVLGWTMAANHWRMPWRFACGTALGSLVFGWYFIWQRFHAHPDANVRFGLTNFDHTKILPLPGYGPLVRVGVVCLLAALIWLIARPVVHSQKNVPSNKKRLDTRTTSPEQSNGNSEHRDGEPTGCSIAAFFVALVTCGWLAQPVQLVLLGKGCQIYHYLVFVLPTLYAYGVVILLFNLVKLALPGELQVSAQKLGRQPGWTGAIVLILVLSMQSIVGMEESLLTVASSKAPRQENSVPWTTIGDNFRPNFWMMEKQFREDPTLQQTRSIATLCHEANFLLTAFYDKKAYLPDNCYSTLSDEELENRFCETLKILQLKPEDFARFVQSNFIMNYWLGCAKYWMATDHTFAPLDDYPDEELIKFKDQEKESPWPLCLPKSELRRLSQKYADTFSRDSDPGNYPDALIVGLERSIGLMPNPKWYHEAFVNGAFSVYIKTPEAAQPENAVTRTDTAALLDSSK